MFFVWISEQTATFALCSINRLGLHNRGGNCLPRGKHRGLKTIFFFEC